MRSIYPVSNHVIISKKAAKSSFSRNSKFLIMKPSIKAYFKKTKALSDFSGEQLAGQVLRPVFALPAENKNQADGRDRSDRSAISAASILAEIKPSADPAIRPIMTQRWRLQPVRRCADGM